MLASGSSEPRRWNARCPESLPSTPIELTNTNRRHRRGLAARLAPLVSARFAMKLGIGHRRQGRGPRVRARPDGRRRRLLATGHPGRSAPSVARGTGTTPRRPLGAAPTSSRPMNPPAPVTTSVHHRVSWTLGAPTASDQRRVRVSPCCRAIPRRSTPPSASPTGRSLRDAHSRRPRLSKLLDVAVRHAGIRHRAAHEVRRCHCRGRCTASGSPRASNRRPLLGTIRPSNPGAV